MAAGDRVASDAADRLHDTAVQALVVARYAADLAVRGGDPQLARDAVQDALVQLRAALWQLRPRTSAEGGLCGALEQLSGQLAAAGRAPLRLRLDPSAAAALPAAGRALVYRLVQAVVLPEQARPVAVVLRRSEAGSVRVEVAGGAPLPGAATWVAAAAALGGSLACAPDPLLHLVLPEAAG